jgi:hypothetical protein
LTVRSRLATGDRLVHLPDSRRLGCKPSWPDAQRGERMPDSTPQNPDNGEEDGGNQHAAGGNIRA